MNCTLTFMQYNIEVIFTEYLYDQMRNTVYTKFLKNDKMKMWQNSFIFTKLLQKKNQFHLHILFHKKNQSVSSRNLCIKRQTCFFKTFLRNEKSFSRNKCFLDNFRKWKLAKAKRKQRSLGCRDFTKSYLGEWKKAHRQTSKIYKIL